MSAFLGQAIEKGSHVELFRAMTRCEAKQGTGKSTMDKAKRLAKER
jgi:hypothetical protein